jgi:hypothetical protein
LPAINERVPAAVAAVQATPSGECQAGKLASSIAVDRTSRYAANAILISPGLRASFARCHRLQSSTARGCGAIGQAQPQVFAVINSFVEQLGDVVVVEPVDDAAAGAGADDQAEVAQQTQLM